MAMEETEIHNEIRKKNCLTQTAYHIIAILMLTVEQIAIVVKLDRIFNANEFLALA